LWFSLWEKYGQVQFFEVFYGELKTAPMIKDCPLCLECELVDTYEKLPTNSIFIGEIMGAYTEDRYLTDGKLERCARSLMLKTGSTRVVVTFFRGTPTTTPVPLFKT